MTQDVSGSCRELDHPAWTASCSDQVSLAARGCPSRLVSQKVAKDSLWEKKIRKAKTMTLAENDSHPARGGWFVGVKIKLADLVHSHWLRLDCTNVVHPAGS